MWKRYHLRDVLVLWVAVLGVAACGGKTTVESDLGIKGAPDWVNEGTQAVDDKGGKLFHGVGQAPPMGDASLQISTADNRARSELAKILSSYMDVVHNDYTAAAKSDAGAITEQAVNRQIKSLTQVNLSGAEILGHWKDEKTGTIYAIAELNLKRIQSALDAVEDMNQDLKQYIRAQSENIFDRFREENR